jgi:hypothetical protein
MDRRYRWAGLYVGGVVVLVLAYALSYNVGMATVENDPQPFLRSLEVVVVHFTTVGYDAEFPSSGPMRTLVGLIRLTGQIVVRVSLVAAVALAVYRLASSTDWR